MVNCNEIADALKSEQSLNAKSFLKGSLFLTLILVLFVMVSAVSAANFTNTDTVNNDIQNFINNDTTDDTEIILNDGDYYNLLNLNITRNLTIRGNGQVNIIGPGTGTLFNITSANVNIINLNISGYTTAIQSNNGNIQVIGNNISTSDHSIYFYVDDRHDFTSI